MELSSFDSGFHGWIVKNMSFASVCLGIPHKENILSKHRTRLSKNGFFLVQFLSVLLTFKLWAGKKKKKTREGDRNRKKRWNRKREKGKLTVGSRDNKENRGRKKRKKWGKRGEYGERMK